MLLQLVLKHLIEFLKLRSYYIITIWLRTIVVIIVLVIILGDIEF